MFTKLSTRAGLVAVIVFIPSILLTAKFSHSFQNWYTTNEYFNWHTMAISHFGVSNLAIPFTAIVCIVSLLAIFFIIGFKKSYGNIGLLKQGSNWIISGFIALMLAFLFLLYEPNSTLSTALHFLVALIYFVNIPIGLLLMGMHFIKNKNVSLGAASVILGVLAFIFGPIICVGSSLLFGDKGVAIPELLQIMCENIWIVLMSVAVLKKEAAETQNSMASRFQLEKSGVNK